MKGIFLVVSVFFVTTLFASDTLLIRANDLNFVSKIDEQVFRNVMNGKPIERFDLAMVIDTTLVDAQLQKAKTAFNQFLESLSAQNLRNKQPDKAFKIIHERVEDQYFKKYELVSSFPNMLNTGVYNCVSGTILYALIFDYLGMPYEIKSTTAHVYIELLTDNKKIVVESTDPLKGYYYVEPESLKKIVESLKTAKQISAADATKSAEEVVNEYSGIKKTTFNELIGFQYFNEALKASENMLFQRSFESFQKAYVLNPKSSTKYMLLNGIGNAIDKEKDDEKKLKMIFKYMRLNPDFDQDIIAQVYEHLLDKNCIQKDNTALMESFEPNIQSDISDSTFRAKLSYLHYFLLGANAYYKHDKQKTFSLLNKAYGFNKENLQLKAMLEEVTMKLFASYAEAEHYDSLGYVLRMITESEIKIENPYIDELYDFIIVGKYFKGKNATAVENMLPSIIEEVKHDKHVLSVEESTAFLYSELANSFYRERNYAKSKLYLKKAMTLAPDNSDFKAKYNQIKDY